MSHDRAFAFDRSMRRVDADGRLHVERTVISIANVCPYYGREIANYEKLGLKADEVYQLYRDPNELQKGAPTYHNVPLLDQHIAISAEIPKKENWAGTVSDIEFEYPYLYGSIAVWDKKSVEKIESEELGQLSAGYYFIADMTPGRAQDGTPYDGVMRELICNHVALVKQGRVGPESAIADEHPRGISKMPSKYPHLAKFLPADADIVAFDAAMDAEKEKEREEAEDAANECYGHAAKDWAEMSAEDKKAARDKHAKDKKAAKDKAAKDANPDHRDDFKGLKDSMISKDEHNASLKALSDKIRADAAAANAAREAVRDVVGAVTMDSAEEIYTFALKQLGVAPSGITSVQGLETLFNAVKVKKSEKPQGQAFDSSLLAHSISSIFPAARA